MWWIGSTAHIKIAEKYIQEMSNFINFCMDPYVPESLRNCKGVCK